MQNLKIRVSSEAEAEEVKRLAVKAGYKLDALFGRKWSDEFCYLVLCENMSAGFGNEIMADGDKSLSMAELRAMANPIKEYLMPDNGGYRVAVQDAGLPIAEDWIEIPELSQFAVLNGDDEIAFYDGNGLEKSHFISSAIIWQRDQDEPFLTPECTLNDQYAEIEQVRQDEMKEYLIPSANYKYQKAYPITSWKEWIEIPNGAEWAKLWDKGESYECVEFYRGENEFFSNSSKKWMRGADQSTNKIGQPATIIWNRHASNSDASLHGTVKAEPDLNFGAAQSTKDNVNHPSHYTSDPSGIECIEVTRHRNFNIGNAMKYLWRNGLKDSDAQIQDLKKAIWYIEDEIKRLEK